MPLARYAASLVGSRVSHDTRVPFPHTSHASSPHDETSQRATPAPTQIERDTRQATTQPTTKASSARVAELSVDIDGGWGFEPGSMCREDNSTRGRFSLAETMKNLLNTAAGPQDPTVEGVRKVVASLNH